MDDWVGYLEGEQSNANGLLLDILSSGYEDWDYLAAVEGPFDRLFYYDFVSDALPGKSVHFLSCGGKNAVISLKGIVEDYDWVNPPKFLYLCDKDYDDYLGKSEHGVWYTEDYSIESYISNRDYVKYIIKKFASKPLRTRELTELMIDFDNSFNYFINHTRAYSAFMCEVRAKGEHPCWDNYGIEKLYDLSQPLPTKGEDRLSRAIISLELDATPTLNDVYNRVRSFKLREFGKWVRGKLLLQLLRKAYDYAQKSAPKNVREHLPGTSYFGSDALNHAFTFVGPIPTLKLYCVTV